jgi:hypothetical protein
MMRTAGQTHPLSASTTRRKGATDIKTIMAGFSPGHDVAKNYFRCA